MLVGRLSRGRAPLVVRPLYSRVAVDSQAGRWADSAVGHSPLVATACRTDVSIDPRTRPDRVRGLTSGDLLEVAVGGS